MVEFSLEPDMTRFVEAGLVEGSWNQNEHKGMVTESVVVFMVRKGNPKQVKGWDDLVTGDVERARGAADLLERQGRCAARLRERGDLAQQQGEEIVYVIPDETILIENPVAVVNESQDPELARSFVDFLYTPEAQEIFAGKGYRPVVDGTPGADEFPTPPKLFEITRSCSTPSTARRRR